MFYNKVVTFAFILLLGGQQVAAAAAQIKHKSAYDHSQRMNRLGRMAFGESLVDLDMEDAVHCDGAAVMALDKASNAVEWQIEALAENCKAAQAKGLKKCASGSDDLIDTTALLKMIQDQAKMMQRAMSCEWAEDWVQEHGKMKNRAERLLKNLEAIFNTAPELTGDLKQMLKFDFKAIESLGDKLKGATGAEGIDEAVQDAMKNFVGEIKEDVASAEKEIEALVKGAEKLAQGSQGLPASKLSNFEFCYRQQNTTWQRFSNYFLGSGIGCDANQGCYAVAGKEFSEKPSLHVLLDAELVEDDEQLAKNTPETWGACLPKNQGKTAAKQFFADVKMEISVLAESMKVASGLGESSFVEGGITPDAQMMQMVNMMLVAGSGYSSMAAAATALCVFEAVTLVLVPYKVYEVAVTGEVGRPTEVLVWLKDGLKAILTASSCTMLHGLAVTGTFTHVFLNGVRSIDPVTGMAADMGAISGEALVNAIMAQAAHSAAIVGAIMFIAGILWLLGIGENALGWTWSACIYNTWSVINHGTGFERIRRPSGNWGSEPAAPEPAFLQAEPALVQVEPAAAKAVRRSAVVRADGDA